ncbi:MAG: phosphoribosylglycinamide formyltransferase [Pseudomonadota bacterium]
MTRLRLAILISGRGSNMEAILNAANIAGYPAQPVLVFSNRPDAGGLCIARNHGVDTVAIDHRPFGEEREAFERELDSVLRKGGVEIVALAGFMRILTPWFVERWVGRMVNIHPSLLPKYPGLNTHARALAAGDAEHGCSVHWVTAGVDAGDVIDQTSIQVLPDDTPETLALRLLDVEHALYPRALAKACRTLLPV